MVQGVAVNGLLFISGHEVEQEPVVIGAGAVGTDAGGLCGVVHPLVDLGAGNISGSDITAEQQLGTDHVGFGVIGFFDALDMNILDIPVLGVALVQSIALRLPLGAQESAAVQNGGVVGTEGSAHLLHELGGSGIAPVIGQTGQEPGAGLGQGVLNLVLTDGLDADGLPVSGLAGFQSQVIVLSAHDVEQQVGGTGGVDGIQDPLGRSDPVFGLDVLVAVEGAVILLPTDAFTDLEGPGQAVLGPGPGLSQAGLAQAVVVVLHQRVDPVGPGAACRGMQGVPVRDLAGVQQFHDLLFGNAFRLAVVGRGGVILAVLLAAVVGLALACVVVIGGIVVAAATGQAGQHHHSGQQ